MLLRAREMTRIRKPTPRNRRSYAEYIRDHSLLAGNDGEFIHHSEDLVALGGDLEDSWFNGVVEDILRAISLRISQVKASQDYCSECSEILMIILVLLSN